MLSVVGVMSNKSNQHVPESPSLYGNARTQATKVHRQSKITIFRYITT